DVLRPVRGNDDRAADAAVPGFRRGACVGAELIDAEQREQGAAHLEDGEGIAVERMRPAQLTVELTRTREVTYAKGDDVREWQLLIHGSLLLRCTQSCHPLQDGLTVMMSPRGAQQRTRHARKLGPYPVRAELADLHLAEDGPDAGAAGSATDFSSRVVAPDKSCEGGRRRDRPAVGASGRCS